jgi:hypothetical protein
MSDPRDLGRDPYGTRRVDDRPAWIVPVLVVLAVLVVAALAYTMMGDQRTAGTAPETTIGRGDRAPALPPNPSGTAPQPEATPR